MKAAKFPVQQNAERPSKYPKDADDGFNFAGISFPTPLNEIPEVERLNNISINVLGYNEKTEKIDILYVSGLEGENIPQINLLYLQKGTSSHYCLIKSIIRLLYSQQQSKTHRLHYCLRCLRAFSSERVLKKHETHTSTEGKTV